MKVIVETSARHAHVCEKDLQVLFGKGAVLTKKKDLSQPGQFASEQKVTIVGPKKELSGVSILGPCRNATQVEISASDARSIGVEAVVRESGDIAGTPGCKIVGPKGEITLAEGVIVAKRHLHTTPEDAKKLNVTDKEIVKLSVGGEGRKVVFGDVVVRVSPKFATAVHLDTDESNAALCPMKDCFGEIIK